MHKNVDPLCAPFSTPNANVGDATHINFGGGIPVAITTPLESHHVPMKSSFNVVIQFGIPLVESYVAPINGIFRRQKIHQ
jgi:hypothetical protein